MLLPRSRRWRAAGVLAVAVLAAVAVVVVAATVTRHAGGTPGAGAGFVPGAPSGVTVPAESPAFTVCAPSPGACSTRIIVIHGVATRIVRAAR